MKKTNWFPVAIEPVRNGVYEVKTPHNNANKYAYFDSLGWRCCDRTIEKAYKERKETNWIGFSSMNNPNSKWRGLAKKP